MPSQVDSSKPQNQRPSSSYTVGTVFLAVVTTLFVWAAFVGASNAKYGDPAGPAVLLFIVSLVGTVSTYIRRRSVPDQVRYIRLAFFVITLIGLIAAVRLNAY